MSRSDEMLGQETRRRFLYRGIGTAALAAAGALGMPGRTGLTADAPRRDRSHFPGKAKHVIYLHMVGVPPRSTCSTTSPKWRPGTTRTCPNPSARASG